MELRQAIESITKENIDGRDLNFCRSLLSQNSWNSSQKVYAERILKKYKMNYTIKKNVPVRRARLREDGKISLHGELWGQEFEAVKNIPGTIINKENTLLPCNKYTLKVLRELNYKFSENLVEWERKNTIEVVEGEFDSRLFPYQKEDIIRVEELNGRCLIGSEMGVGKTCIACTYIARHPELETILIIVPASLKLNWVRELRQWGYKDRITIINGSKSKLPTNGVIIMSYNIVYSYYCEIEEIKIDLLVLDESHYIKRSESKRTKAIKYLGGGIDKIICISGTPITSRPKEFFTTLSLLNKEMFNNRERFLKKYCNSSHDPTGNGSSNSKELYKILSESFMIRRLKKDILTQLPPKMYSVIPIEMESGDREKYEFAKREIIQYLKENYGKEKADKARWAQTIVRMAHLRQLAVAGKMNESVEFVRNMIDSGEKIVIFAIHKVVIERLMEEFGDIAVKIDGSVSQKQRQKNVDKFQNDSKTKIFIGQIDSAGVGITLTASSNVVFFEYPFNPGQVSQAIDRCHRIGQEAESINVWYLVAENTIDSDIAKILDRKAKVLADILDGGDLDEDILINQLIENLRNS